MPDFTRGYGFRKNFHDGKCHRTIDLHLGHRGIIEMQKHPFENVEEIPRTVDFEKRVNGITEE